MTKKTVALKFARLSVPKKIEKARFIVTSMTNNSNFPSPSPSLATITTDINNLEQAHIAAQGGSIQATANMHSKELQLELALKAIGSYVETIANANPATAEPTILSAGIDVKVQAIHVAHEFNLTSTGNPGEVKMATKAAKRSTYIFQMCSDPSAETNWSTIEMSTRCSFVKTGLTSGTRYYFRVSVVDKNGQGPWSNVLNTIVL